MLSSSCLSSEALFKNQHSNTILQCEHMFVNICDSS